MNLTTGDMNGIFAILAWIALWGLGGVWIIRTSFTLRKNEILLAGLGLGLVLENWLTNLAGQFLDLSVSLWVAAGLVFVVGLLFSLSAIRKDPLSLFKISLPPLQILIFLALVYTFFVIGRGFAILDDYQNLPTAALIATGDIPPHFPLNPGISYGYHYFTLLLAAQFMHIGNLFVWTALDLARSIGFSFSIMLGALFVQRVTGSVLAGWVSGMMNVFAGGTRWLLLLLPSEVLDRLGANLTMLGSGAASGQDLTTALSKAWASSGLGPFPFPFAFVNGINSTSIITYHAGAGGMAGMIAVLLMLVHNKWNGWRAWVVVSLLMASFGLANEVNLSTICIGIVLVILIYMAIKRTWQVPKSLWRWLVATGAGGLISLFQGGVITSTVMSTLASWFPGWIKAEPAYHTFEFSLFWPPKVLSSHLGYLSLDDPAQILLALAEIGPILIVTPLVIAWLVKAFRFGRWYECFQAAAAVASLVLLVVQLKGAAGITALTRVQTLPLGVLGTFCVPSLWLWARHRSDTIKALCASLLSIMMFGGVVLFGISLIAAPKPVLSNFIDLLDASMSKTYFDNLEKDAYIFDSIPYRAPTLFGRSTKSSTDFYTATPEWKALKKNPDPFAIRAAGYDYIYLDKEYWTTLTREQKDALGNGCVQMVQKVESQVPPDFRKLLDITNCE